MNKKLIYCISGFLAGIVNGLLGAAGGMVIVPMLTKTGMETKNAHANSVAVILVISCISTILYLKDGIVSISMVFPYMLWGVAGSILGAFTLTKIKDTWIKRLFGVLMIWAAVRLLMR